jgi:hypothetical protein
MMMDARTVAQAYLSSWNEADPRKRQVLLAEHWTPDAAYADPMASVDGRDKIAALIDAVQQRFPGYRFSLLGEPDGHGQYVRLSWSLGPVGGDAPIEGSDVVTLVNDKIHRVVGFIDRAPAGS